MNLTVPAGQPLRDATTTDFSDLTTALLSGDPVWTDGDTLTLPFTPEPTVAEQKAIRLRLMTRDADHEAWVNAVIAARAELDLTNSAHRLIDLLAAEATRAVV